MIIFLNKKILECTLKCAIYNTSGHVVSDIQTRAEGECFYIPNNTDVIKWLVKRLDENIRILQQFKINE